MLVAHSAENAWQNLLAETIDLVLSDHTVPAMTGARPHERLRATHTLAHLPFILWSGSSLEEGISFDGVFFAERARVHDAGRAHKSPAGWHAVSEAPLLNPFDLGDVPAFIDRSEYANPC
ncbi:hypothetical protein [Paraburkholderia phytofirmans]|uniref:hypothetical protein n=1 Tax=Paraburkholderia phytofirmans TaxID=261302 RepID=UPI0013149582|nr:hypothetical protein [Paraburkholderia phytofirmans]